MVTVPYYWVRVGGGDSATELLEKASVKTEGTKGS